MNHGTANARAAAYCPDCGPVTVPHWVERLSARVDRVAVYLQKPPELIWRGVGPLAAAAQPGRLMPVLAGVLDVLGLAKVVTTPDDKVNSRASVMWKEADRRGIVMKELRIFGMPREFFWAVYKGRTIGFEGLPRGKSGASSRSLDWMDDKGVIIEKFRNAGIPVPRGKTCTTAAQAEAAWRSVGGSVVVKPNLGSRSRHTYIHLNNASAVRKAFIKAKELSPWVVVEEELAGFVFRVTLVNGDVAGVMRREPPHVIGDGTHTVRELAERENKNPLRCGPVFHEIALGGEAIEALKKQDLALDSVPPDAMMVLLHDKVSRSCGASTTEVTNIHPDNLALFSKIALVLADPLVGVDFMIPDMERPWRDQKCGVIECNSLPFIDLHHFPLKGPAVNVAGMVWGMAFPEKS